MTSPRIRRSRRALVAVAVAVAGGLVLNGCAAGEDSAGDAASITLPFDAPSSFDPAALDNSFGSYIWAAVYDTLLVVDDAGEIVPNAADWEYTDNRTLVLTLRDDVTFSSGEAVTSADVVATLEYIRDTPGANQKRASTLASIDAPDERTIVLGLTEPDPELLVNLASTLGVIADPDVLGTPEAATVPVGAGPYVIDTEATVSGSRYVLTRRDDHWNADSYPFATYTMRVLSDPQAVFNAMQAGEVDGGPAQPDGTEALMASGFDIVTVENIATLGLTISDRGGQLVPALGDLRVRQAINMAFDREQYVEQLLGGDGTPTVQKLKPSSGAYDPELEETYPYDPERARELLAEAGYPDGFRVTMPSSPVPAFEPSVSESLSAIGIEVEWEAVPIQDLVGAMQSQRYGMVFTGDGSFIPANVMIPSYAENGRDNPFAYTTPELTALLDAAIEGDAGPDSDRLWGEVNRYAVEQALNAPLFFTNTSMAVDPDFTYTATEQPAVQRIDYWGVAQ